MKTRECRGFTLIELLVVLAIILTLGGLAFPIYKRVEQSEQAGACLSNLRQLGVALNLYLADHNLTMPVLEAGRSDLSQNLPVIDNTLNTYAPAAAVFACPSDTAGLAARTGTSYYWNVALNGQSLTSLSFLNLTNDQTQIPILSDKEGFHPYGQNKVNLLYADGHVTKDLSFYTSK